MPSGHHRKIYVIGDSIVDEYVRCKVRGVSAEHPTLVVEELSREKYIGGASLVVRNMLRLLSMHGLAEEDIVVKLISNVSGKDLRAADTSDRIEEDECEFLYSYKLSSACTTKTRYFVDNYKVFQTDKIAGEAPKLDLFGAALSEINEDDVIVICDNRHGFMTPLNAAKINELSNGAKIYVDSQVSQSRQNYGWYERLYGYFLNEKELRSLTDIDDHLEAIKDVTMDRGLQRTILKRGDKGAMLYDRTSGWVAEPAHHARAVDTCGAGDAFMAAFIIREMIGSPLHMCLDKANLWASKSIETVGTVVPSKEEAERWW